MPIHSIVSDYDIFLPQNNSELDIKTKPISGGSLEMIRVNGQYRVNRLFSTDPAMYLDARYQPTRFYD